MPRMLLSLPACCRYRVVRKKMVQEKFWGYLLALARLPHILTYIFKKCEDLLQFAYLY